MRFHILILGLLLFMGGCQQAAQTPKPPAPEPQAAASDAISTLQKLVNAQNYKGLGFDSVDEVKQAQLGTPFAVFDIGLDQLKGYKAGSDANSLLTPSSKAIYPVIIGGEVKSSVTVSHQASGYKASSFGNAEIVKGLSRYRTTQPAAGDFVVRVPALNMFYLGRRVENRLLLVPITNDPRLKLKAGEAMGADSVLQQLVPLANAYNGLPL